MNDGRPQEEQNMAARTVGQTELAFTSSQAASYLGVSLATVRRWTNNGHLHGYRTPGGQRRFSRAQLDDFIRSLSSLEPSREEQSAA
jgi:excisionase family DNA binding protein